MIYIHPQKRFFDKALPTETEKIAKVQIDNSINFGWDRKDIILVTNFDYEYNGVTSFVVPDNLYCNFYKQGSKINALSYLFENNFPIEKNETLWFHDLDAFQSDALDLNIEKADMALSDYNNLERWNTGSIFFKKSARDIFTSWRDIMNEFKIGDEQALLMLVYGSSKEKMQKYKLPYDPNRVPVVKNINDRIKRINITYNFASFELEDNYRRAIKPLKVVHFHPLSAGNRLMGARQFNFFAGQNKINTVLMSKTLMKTFHYHGINPSW